MAQKFAVCVVVFSIALLLAGIPCHAETRTAYFVGNSFTRISAPDGMVGLAAQQSNSLAVGYHIYHGSPIHAIWGSPNNTSVASPSPYGKFGNALPNYEWDAVTLQPFYKGNWNGFDPATMQTDIDSVISFADLTRQNPANSDTKFYLYQSWPFVYLSTPFQEAWDKTSVDDLATRSSHKREYYDDLIERVRAQTAAEVYMIPISEVLYALDTRMKNGDVPGYTSIDQFFQGDGLHLDEGPGTYVAGATAYATIFGENPDGLVRPTGYYGDDSQFSPELYDALNETIWDVVSNHEYTGVPEPTTLALLSLGGLVALRRRRSTKHG